MTALIYQVDAFTDRPFAGNPAGVCLLSAPRPDAWLQAVAVEMNLSETAFLLPEADDTFRLRWFTPATEVKLCGHATLASAHILWERGVLQPDAQARFHTLSGLLTAARRNDWIEMDFPAKIAAPAEAPAGLAEMLGLEPTFVGRNGLTYLVEVASETAVRGLRPDFGALGKLPVRCLIVTARSATPGFDFISRFFAPAIGIPEDPVTGSAHCYLTPYWAARLGRSAMVAYQASARGGVLRVRCEPAGDRVILAGQAVTVLSGEFLS